MKAITYSKNSSQNRELFNETKRLCTQLILNNLPNLYLIFQTSIRTSSHTFEAFRTGIAISRIVELSLIKRIFLFFHEYNITRGIAYPTILAGVGIKPYPKKRKPV